MFPLAPPPVTGWPSAGHAGAGDKAAGKRKKPGTCRLAFAGPEGNVMQLPEPFAGTARPDRASALPRASPPQCMPETAKRDKRGKQGIRRVTAAPGKRLG